MHSCLCFIELDQVVNTAGLSGKMNHSKNQPWRISSLVCKLNLPQKTPSVPSWAIPAVSTAQTCSQLFALHVLPGFKAKSSGFKKKMAFKNAIELVKSKGSSSPCFAFLWVFRPTASQSKPCINEWRCWCLIPLHDVNYPSELEVMKYPPVSYKQRGVQSCFQCVYSSRPDCCCVWHSPQGFFWSLLGRLCFSHNTDGTGDAMRLNDFPDVSWAVWSKTKSWAELISPSV